jgi:predicted component of type VI protein secretion system
MKTLLGCILLCSLSGCFMLASTPEGLRAYSDSQIGLVSESRTNPDIKGSYWQHREKFTGLTLGGGKNGK